MITSPYVIYGRGTHCVPPFMKISLLPTILCLCARAAMAFSASKPISKPSLSDYSINLSYQNYARRVIIQLRGHEESQSDEKRLQQQLHLQNSIAQQCVLPLTRSPPLHISSNNVATSLEILTIVHDYSCLIMITYYLRDSILSKLSLHAARRKLTALFATATLAMTATTRPPGG